MPSQSTLQQARLKYKPTLPKALHHLSQLSTAESDCARQAPPQISALFPLTHQFLPLKFTKGTERIPHPLKVGVVLSGGQAPGGHNVITGLYDALTTLNPASTLIGFLNGPKGIVENKSIDLTPSLLSNYRNQGGFDMIGSGRTKIETKEQFQAAVTTINHHQLDGLVIIGGDDSNTNAALLAEYAAAHHCKASIIGVPKTIDGDLKSDDIEISFGFDTASKNYAATIGSLMRDVLSAQKYYYFIKLMGRSASHITLECALQTHPNLAFISEEVAAKKSSLKDIVDTIANLICKRSLKGKDYGVILIPEGVVEFIPEVKKLIQELNALLSPEKKHCEVMDAAESEKEKIAYIEKLLSKEALSCFASLPKDTQAQLLIGRDSHGNVQVSQIETERMLIAMVKKELKQRTRNGTYKGAFSPLSSFCGYEGRSCMPSNFDSQYCYALGFVAALLVDSRANGYICRLGNLSKPAEEWVPGGIPLTSMMVIEERHGAAKPVIRKALVDLEGKPFEEFKRRRAVWEEGDDYVDPGPIQFFGDRDLTDTITRTLALEK